MTLAFDAGAWRSISGVRLEGSKLTRIVYLDESGLEPRHPTLVVAAVIVHADTQMGPLEDGLQEIIDKNVAEKNRPGFVLHAADLFYGNKKHLPEEIWAENIRLKMLRGVLELPAKIRLQLCFGLVVKSRFPQGKGGTSDQKRRIAMHASAIAAATMASDSWIKENTDEVAFIIAENNDEVREASRETQVMMKRPDAVEIFGTARRNHLPLARIKDGINFTRKEESKALQMADACAWLIRRTGPLGSKDAKVSYLYDLLKPQIRSWHMTTLDEAKRLS
jgi:hypothetical protein